MAQPIKTRYTARGTRMPPKGREWQRSLCEECGRPVTPKQTFKFTETGGKIHYYCDPRQNPTSSGDIRTLQQGVFEHAGGRPHRAYSVAKAKVRNDHGVLETYTVYVNRTSSRWWLEKLVGEEPDLSEGWMSPKAHLSHQTLFYEFATSSPKKAQEWIDAVTRLSGGVENPAGPTFHQAVVMARAAGAKIGDTDGFGPWLAKAGLSDRSPQVRRELETAFWVGVEHGAAPATRTPRQAAGKPQIWQTEDGWKTALDPESTFDTRELAEQFVASQRNPGVASIRSQYLKLVERYAYAYESRNLARMNAAHEALERFETKYNLAPDSRSQAISHLKRTRAGLSLQHALDSINDFQRNPSRQNPNEPWWKRRTA
jgi:hypothetical protein